MFEDMFGGGLTRKDLASNQHCTAVGIGIAVASILRSKDLISDEGVRGVVAMAMTSVGAFTSVFELSQEVGKYSDEESMPVQLLKKYAKGDEESTYALPDFSRMPAIKEAFEVNCAELQKMLGDSDLLTEVKQSFNKGLEDLLELSKCIDREKLAEKQESMVKGLEFFEQIMNGTYKQEDQ